jgi:2-polyprenyl-6-hydroxyphenyl methylase/3-demethylubiquinone-9 3-methyltransferase
VTSHPEFVRYYTEQSRSDGTIDKALALRDTVLRFARTTDRPLDIGDVGCGAGTLSLVWARAGHRVRGLDICQELVEEARRRAAEGGWPADFRVGSACALPWPAESLDVCFACQLLEHVPEWEACLDEFRRVLRPGGVLFISTTNMLCPRQEEFYLPLYSWYPARLKQRYERLALTSRPELAGYAPYPAVNWFSFYSLRRELRRRGFRPLDRFDVMDLRPKGRMALLTVLAIRALPPLRWLAHVCTPYASVLAIKG